MKISDIDIARHSTRYLDEMFDISFVIEGILSDQEYRRIYLFGIIEEMRRSDRTTFFDYYGDICKLMHALDFPIGLITTFLRDIIGEKSVNNYVCSCILFTLDTILGYYEIDTDKVPSGVIYLISLYRKEGATSA